MLIRGATLSDLDAVIAVAPAGSERQIALREHVAAGECHVAWLDGRAVGYLVLTRSFFHSAFVELLVTAEAQRRTGIGSALMRHAIVLTPPGEKLWTSTNRSNLPMQGLLDRLGFMRSGIVENLDPGDPELIYFHPGRAAQR